MAISIEIKHCSLLELRGKFLIATIAIVLVVVLCTNCAWNSDLRALNMACEQHPSPHNGTTIHLGFSLFPEQAASSGPSNASLSSPSSPLLLSSRHFQSISIGLGVSLGLVLSSCFAMCTLVWAYRKRVRTVEKRLESLVQEESYSTKEVPCHNCAQRIEAPAKEMVGIVELDGLGFSKVEG